MRSCPDTDSYFSFLSLSRPMKSRIDWQNFYSIVFRLFSFSSYILVHFSLFKSVGLPWKAPLMVRLSVSIFH